MNRYALRWCARIIAADSPAVECPPVWVTSAVGLEAVPPARAAEPVAEVDVLEVHEEALVEAADCSKAVRLTMTQEPESHPASRSVSVDVAA